MIELINVTKYYQTDIGRHYVLRDVSLKIPRDLNVAIIGPNGAGKSTLLRLIAGVDTPNSGKIIRTGRISWPMGLTPGTQQSLNGLENARFACRIYGMSKDEIRATIDRVRQIADIGKYFDLPVNTYSAGMRQRLSFAISISLDFDYYLFDEIGAGGDRAFRKLANELIDKRLSTSNFIMVSHAPSDIIELCKAAILLRDATATYFDDVRAALAEYGEQNFLAKPGRRRKSRRVKQTAQIAGGNAADGLAAAVATPELPSADAAAKRDAAPRKKHREKKPRQGKLRAQRRLTRELRKKGHGSQVLDAAPVIQAFAHELLPAVSKMVPESPPGDAPRHPSNAGGEQGSAARKRRVARRRSRQTATLGFGDLQSHGTEPDTSTASQSEPLAAAPPHRSKLRADRRATARRRKLQQPDVEASPAVQHVAGAATISPASRGGRKSGRQRRFAVSTPHSADSPTSSSGVGIVPDRQQAASASNEATAARINQLAERWAVRAKAPVQEAALPGSPADHSASTSLHAPILVDEPRSRK